MVECLIVTIVAKIRLLWNAIPGQLAKENKKLVYAALRPGARAREYEIALQWLEDAGMIRQVHRVSRQVCTAEVPARFAFKKGRRVVG